MGRLYGPESMRRSIATRGPYGDATVQTFEPESRSWPRVSPEYSPTPFTHTCQFESNSTTWLLVGGASRKAGHVGRVRARALSPSRLVTWLSRRTEVAMPSMDKHDPVVQHKDDVVMLAFNVLVMRFYGNGNIALNVNLHETRQGKRRDDETPQQWTRPKPPVGDRERHIVELRTSPGLKPPVALRTPTWADRFSDTRPDSPTFVRAIPSPTMAEVTAISAV